MAAKVQLDIESRANTKALEEARAALERVGAAGKTTNQVFKSTSDLETYKAAMVKNYESARIFGDQMKATRTAMSDANKAIQAAQAYLGQDKGNVFSYIDEQGVRQQTRNMDIIEKHIRSFLSDVSSDTENYQKSLTRNMGEFEGFDNFNKKLEQTAGGYRLMGDELGAVQYKMGEIKNQILSMQSSYGDPEQIKQLANEYNKLSVEHARLAKEADGTGMRIKHLLKNFISAQLVVWALRKAFSGLVNGLKESSKAAAEAEQTFGRFEAVFEGLERANVAIDTMVDNFGIAKSSAADILSYIGNTALGFGATAMEAAQFSERVAASLSDIMAFRDVSGTISDFAQRFMSGASGNVENFRAIGSIVRQTMVDLELQKQGWENLTGQALEWAKVQARVNIVMEQQRKAMGATEREWDSMLSIQRRHQEANKQLKENLGETINQFFKPLSQWWLQIKEDINDATQAQKNFEKGMPSKAPVIDIETDEGIKRAEKLLMGLLSKQYGTYTVFGKTFGIDVDMITAVADAFGITAEQVAKIALDQESITDEMWEQLRIHDKMTASARNYAKAESDRIANSQAAADALRDFSADLGAMMNLGRSAGMPDVMEFIGKAPSDFITPLERLLGFDEGEQGELEAKIKSLSTMVEMLFNASISGATEFIRSQASEMLEVVSDALLQAQKAKKAMESATEFKTMRSGILAEIASIEKRNELEKQYGEEGTEIASIMHQQWQAEQGALEMMDKRLKATGDEKLALREYRSLMELISKQYGIQLDLAKDKARVIRDAKADEAADLFTAAQRELSYLGPNGDALRAQDEINDKVAEYEALLKSAGFGVLDISKKSQEYRDVLVATNDAIDKNEADKNAKDAKENVDALTDSYEAQLQALRDNIGMIEYRASLEGQYDEKVIDLMVQRKQLEAEALAYMNQQINAGMERADAEEYYKQQIALIGIIHDANLDLLKEQIQATKDLAIEQAKTSADDMFTAASRELAYLGANGDALRAQDEINDKVDKYVKYLTDANIAMDERNRKAEEYRAILEAIAKYESISVDEENADNLVKPYTDRIAALLDEIQLMEYRASLTSKYAEDEQGIVDLLVQKKQQEMDALAFMDKQVDAGMDAEAALEQYKSELRLIGIIHDANLDLLKEQIQATKDLAIEQAKTSADDMFTAASRELAYLGANGDALRAQDEINDKVEQYIEYLSKTGDSTSDVIRKAKEFRDVLEQIASLTQDDKDKKTAQDFTDSYKDRVMSLREAYDSLRLSADLEKQYGSDRAAIEQKYIEAQQEAWRYMQKQVDAGMDATEAENFRLESAQLITAEYQLQLDLLKQQQDEKRAEALQNARDSIAGVKAQRALVDATDAQKTQARIDEQVWAFAEELTQGGAKLKETLDKTAEYRRQLEMLAAEESYQAVKDSIKATWKSLGDIGMIQDWIDNFKDIADIDGDKAAMKNTIEQIILEFAGHLESVNRILGIVTEFFERIAPAFDQFLAPLMPVLEMLVSIMADLLLPVLQILFPIIQGLSVALVFLLSVVKTVTNALSWLVDTITTAVWNIAHPFKQRDFRALNDETKEIWEEANATVEKIMAMEIDTRMGFISELTDAQKGELDAYNEMFKAGLLTLTQYQAMVGKNVYGKNFDNVAIESFAKGGDFMITGRRLIEVGEEGPERVQITPLNSSKYAERGSLIISNASYSVVVNGANADPEEIALSVRRELNRMERRGIKYA